MLIHPIINSNTYNNKPIVTQNTGCKGVTFTSKKLNKKNLRKVIIMIGAPNSGKGTYSRLLSKRFSIPAIGAGDIMRDKIKTTPDLKEKAKELLDVYGLVPKYTNIIKAIVFDAIKQRAAQTECRHGFILEGFPRCTKDAEMLEELLQKFKEGEVKVVHLDVNEQTLYERAAKRYICPDCYKTYALTQYNPQKAKCECGGTLTKREDDTPEILGKRLQKYYKETLPLVRYYKGKVIKIRVRDNNTSKSDILNNIVDKL